MQYTELCYNTQEWLMTSVKQISMLNKYPFWHHHIKLLMQLYHYCLDLVVSTKTHTHTKIRPCNIIGNAGSYSCKGYIRDSIITGFNVLSQGSPVWNNMVGMNHKSYLSRNNNKNVSADLDGSTKSCNQVQTSSQTSSAHEKAWSKSLFSHMYSTNSFSQPFRAHGKYKNT
jgi:hypothetical protein